MAFGVLVGGRIARRVLSGIIRRGGVRLGGRGGLLRSFLRGKADDIGFDLQDLRRSVRRQPGIRITGKAITRRYNRRGSRTSVRWFSRDIRERTRAHQLAFTHAMVEQVRRSILPRVRNALPRRTGRLRRYLRMQVRRDRVQIRGMWYARLVRFRRNPVLGSQSVAGAFHKAMRERMPAMVRAAAAIARRAV